VGGIRSLVSVTFGAGAPAPAADLARLHRELLPTSPILAVGPHFLERFYYRVLPDEGLVLGTVVYDDSEPVGFVAATRSANTFMTTAVRRRWADLAKVLLRHPPNPKAVANTLRLARQRAADQRPDTAELLSLGVRPAAKGASPERRRLGRDLVRQACEQLGDVTVQALVDEGNVSARVLYADLGWIVTDRVTEGWPVPQLVFTSPAPATVGA
jgi:ribosomal protein S18 acetylase RimI-like enzyme